MPPAPKLAPDERRVWRSDGTAETVTLDHPETLYSPGHWRALYCQPPELLQIQRVPIARATDIHGREYWGVADQYKAAMLDAGTFRTWFPKAPDLEAFAFLVSPHPRGMTTAREFEITTPTPGSLPPQSVRVKGLPGWNGSGFYPMPMAGWLWAREQWRLGRRWIGLEVAR